MTKEKEVENLGKQYDLWQTEYDRICDRCGELETELAVEREHLGMVRQKMSLLGKQIMAIEESM